MGGDVHLALDGDVRIRHGRSKQLAQGSKNKRNGGRHLPLPLHGILHLLEERILENGVDDEHQRRDDSGEQGSRALLLQQGHERPQGGRALAASATVATGGLEVGLLAARGDARVDDPDGVGDDDGGRAGNGAGDHGLDGGELLAGAAGAGGGLFEKGPRPLVPVVVDEVGDADAEEGRVDARVQAREALARDDLLDGLGEVALGLFGLDLGSGGEGDERVAVPGVGMLAMRR